MSELEDKLNSMLSDPQLMSKVMQLAGSVNRTASEFPKGEQPGAQAEPLPDLGMLSQLSQLAGQGNIDSHQQSLLCALEPYLSRYRIQKLEKAMRAAKLAQVASTFLNSGGLSLLTGR